MTNDAEVIVVLDREQFDWVAYSGLSTPAGAFRETETPRPKTDPLGRVTMGLCEVAPAGLRMSTIGSRYDEILWPAAKFSPTSATMSHVDLPSGIAKGSVNVTEPALPVSVALAGPAI